MSAVEKLKLHESHPAYRWREDFPILGRKVHGRPLVYLDNAATSQKPLAVIEAEDRYYREYNSNIHRGVHALSQAATDAYEKARARIQKYLNARSHHEIIFVRGATEGLNLVAQSFGRPRLRPGDEIIVSAMEHHSNIVPWQLACEQSGALLKVVPMTDAGEFIYEEFERLLGPRTRIVAVTHVSNALGTILPVKRIIEAAHAQGVPVVLDGAQAIPHTRVDVQALGCDFYAFSGHKVYGPTGIGVLYGREKHLEAMPPWQGGGDMIRTVSFEKSTWNDLPYKFEAGTPHIAGGIGLGVALDYLDRIGIEAVAAHEHELLEYATGLVSEIPGLKLIGTAAEKAGVLSFVMDHAHPHDVGTILDHQGVAIRAGHHCAMPVMDRYNIPGTARASFALYNTREDVDALVAGIHKVKELFD